MTNVRRKILICLRTGGCIGEESQTTDTERGGVSETDSSDNKLSRAPLTLSERHDTQMYTSEGGEGGQTD